MSPTNDPFLDSLAEQARGTVHQKRTRPARTMNETISVRSLGSPARPESPWPSHLLTRKKCNGLAQELWWTLHQFGGDSTPLESQLHRLLQQYMVELRRRAQESPPPRPTRAELNPPEGMFTPDQLRQPPGQ